MCVPAAAQSNTGTPGQGLSRKLIVAQLQDQTTVQSIRDQIRAAQRALLRAGYNVGPLDGIIGPDTERALRAFQKARQLPVTGELDKESLAALKVGGPPVEIPDSQKEIRAIQEALRRAGYDPGPLDGVFGPNSQRALRAFQKARQLSVTGELDEKSLAALQIGQGKASSEADTPQETSTPKPGVAKDTSTQSPPGTGSAPQETSTQNPPGTSSAPQETSTQSPPGAGSAPQETSTPSPSGSASAPQETSTQSVPGTGSAPQETSTQSPSGTGSAPQEPSSQSPSPAGGKSGDQPVSSDQGGPGAQSSASSQAPSASEQPSAIDEASRPWWRRWWDRLWQWLFG